MVYSSLGLEHITSRARQLPHEISKKYDKKIVLLYSINFLKSFAIIRFLINEMPSIEYLRFFCVRCMMKKRQNLEKN